MEEYKRIDDNKFIHTVTTEVSEQQLINLKIAYEKRRDGHQKEIDEINEILLRE